MAVVVDMLRERGVISALDWHFARAVARIGGDERPLVLLAAALASRAVGQGHVCLDLPGLIGAGVMADDSGAPIACDWPPAPTWLEALGSSGLVAATDEGATTPFVLDDRGRLYLRRYWQHQLALVTAIRERAGVEETIDQAGLAEGLSRLFPDAEPGAGAEPDWQCVAAATAVLRRLCIISGGPGSGKTYTVVRILALLIEQALAAERRPPRIVLLAPTGKAAARLAEAIRAGKAALPCAGAVAAAIPDVAATIHRGLGALPGRSTMFRHGPANPLLADVVLVDEASMVDLALMARLIAAMPAEARLILLGDQDQLASVEAGAVLGDLCNSGAPRPYSAAHVARLGGLGMALPSPASAPHATGIGDCIVQLTRSYRYRAQSGIGCLAAAIKAGELDGVDAAFAVGADVARSEPPPDGTLGADLERVVCDGFAPYLAATDPLAALDALARFRVLCAHRRGPFGVEAVNAQIEQILAGTGRLRPLGSWYERRPILITRNDYQLQLFNGDIGVIFADPRRPGEHAAVFVGADGAPRWIAPSRLPPHETVFAMSVHKSQGSELDGVVVLLPLEPSPIVSRELLYTAVTRARRRAVVVARHAVLAHAVSHRVERASGLRDALWE